MDIKLLAFDLDGTIVKADQKTITERSIQAIEYVANKGIDLIIATGRMYSSLPKELIRNKNISYFITSNGAKLYSAKTGEMLYRSSLNYSKVRELSNLADELELFYELYCDGKSYAPRKNKENIYKYHISERFFEILNTRPISFETLDELENKGKEVEKFNMLSIPSVKYEKVWDAFLKIKGINQVSSIKVNIEINSEKTSKWNAIKELCNIKKIKYDEVMTIGDSGNDYEMIKNAGFGVAMGNGIDEVKNVAKYVTKGIEEDGFYEAIVSLL